jgi:Fic family protein
MKYITLRSLSYQDKEEYEKDYLKRTESSSAFFFNIDIHDNRSFLIADWEIMSLIESIGRNNAAAAQVYTLLPGVAQAYYSRKCLIDEIQTTNDIEGVYSTRQEIKDALNANEERTKLTRFQGIAKKYEKLLQIKEPDISLKTCRDIRKLYDEIVSHEIEPEEQPNGMIFRRNTVFVVSSTGQKRHEGVNPEEKIIDYIEEALRILETDELPMLVRIAVFHYFFGYIHPFYDGNGRINRFISSYLIKKNKYPLLALDLSHTIKEHRKIYYNAFRECNDKKNKGDITPFVITFLEFLDKSSDRMKHNLQERYEKMRIFKRLIDSKLADDDKQRGKKSDLMFLFLQNSFFSIESFSIAELQNNMECSRTTLEKLLSDLVNEGYPIIISKESKPYKYHLDLEKLEEIFEND